MSDYTWTGGGGVFNSTTPWTVGGATPQNPPGAPDSADFPNGGNPTGGGTVMSISVEGATTFSSGTYSTQTVNATADVTVDNAGDLDASGDLFFLGNVTLQNASQLEGDFATFAGSNVTIDGANTSFTLIDDFDAQATTQFTVSNGAIVTTGTGPGDLDVIETGSLSITTGASLTAADLTTFNGTTWSVDQGATMTATGGGNLAGAGKVGFVFNGTGTIDAATVTTQAGLAVGGEGFEGVASSGTATVQNGASVTAGNLILGDYNGDDGELTLTGDGTTMTITSTPSFTNYPGLALIGNDGEGTLNVQGGATLDEICGTGGFASISFESDGRGEATVDGEGSTWSIQGTLNAGDGGTGTLDIKNKGQVEVTTLFVSAQDTSGTLDDPTVVTVDGSGSAFTVDKNATIDTATPTTGNNSDGKPNGFAGKWEYTDTGVSQTTISNGGFISVGGTLTLQSATDDTAIVAIVIESGGGMEVGGDAGLTANELIVDDAGLIIGHGTIAMGDPSAGESADTGMVDSSGTIEAFQGTLEIDGDISGQGLYEIDKNATMRIDGTVDAATTITFDGQYVTTLMLDQENAFLGTAANFQEGDIIDLTQVQPVSPIRVTLDTSGTVTLQPLGGSGGGVSGSQTNLKISGPDVVPVIGLQADQTGSGTNVETIDLLTLLGISFATYGYNPSGGASAPAQINDYAPVMIAYPGANGDNGFEGFAYEDDNDDDPNPTVVIAFRGTYGLTTGDFNIFIKNLLSGSSFVTGQVTDLLSRYVQDAVAFVLKVQAAYANSPIFVTGHSLGGALAQLVGYESGLPVAAFDAPGTGALISQLSGALDPLSDLAVGGSDVNYRTAGDIVSLLGTPIPGGQTFTVPSPYAQTSPSLLLNNVLNSHGLTDYTQAFGALASGPLTEGTGGQQLNLLQQTIVNNAVNLFGNVAGGIDFGADPPAGTDFLLTIDPGSVAPNAIGLPILAVVTSYQLRYEVGTTWSAFQSVSPGTLVSLPGEVDAVEFQPLDQSGTAVEIPGSEFVLEFPGSGQFSGTVTASGGTAIGPVTTAASVTAPAGGSATPLNIPSPTDTDASYPASTLAVEVTGLPTNGTVTLADGTTPVTLDESLTVTQLTGLTFTPAANTGGQSSTFSYDVIDPTLQQTAGAAIIQVACFMAGTRVATTRGEIPVEELAVGDLVHSRFAGVVPIQWIGVREIDCLRHPEPAGVWPVRVTRNAFGPGLPIRDLWLSPDHAVFVDDVLIPIKYLINGTSVAQMAVNDVTYYHVELPCHDLLLVEGLPAESYLDTGDRGTFANGGGVPHPEFSVRIWEGMACAPLIVTGTKLNAVKRRIARSTPRTSRVASARHHARSVPGYGSFAPAACRAEHPM